MKIIILYATAGNGHKKAAEYLEEEFAKRKSDHPDLEVKNIDFLKYTPAHFRFLYPWSYHFMVSKIPPFWGFAYWLTDIQWFYRLVVAPLRRIFNKVNSFGLEKFLIEENPDVLIFTHFFPPEVTTKMKKKGKIKSKLVTVVTDFFPHSTWINPGTDYFITMTEGAELKLMNWGVDESRVKVFGIPVASKFEFQGKKKEMREQFGLDPEKFTLLLTSGAFGIGPFEEVINALQPLKEKIQLLVVCGDNKALFNRLEAKKDSIPGKIFGFVNNMDELMEASDLVVAKTGGLTTSESLSKIVPLVISKPIPGQETGNANFLLEKDCAYQMKEPKDIVKIVEENLGNQDSLSVLNNSPLAKKRENIKKVRKPKATKDIVDFVLTLERTQ